jgi:hypothetical protein
MPPGFISLFPTAWPTHGVRSVELESEPYPKRRFDAITGVMMVLTLVAIGAAGWLRFGRSSTPASATVGAGAPALRLIDLETAEPVMAAGLEDKVAWIVFWSAAAPSGRSCLANLESATRQLRRHRRFAMVAAAVEVDDPAKVREVVREAEFKLPVHLVGPETRRRFHAESADPPVHVLIDNDGRILATARAAGEPTISRLVELASQRLDEIDPDGEMRFAAAAGR